MTWLPQPASTEAKFNVEYEEDKDVELTIKLTTGKDYKVDKKVDLTERVSGVEDFTVVEDVKYVK